MRVHLDTDFGGDPDDACALAMLLGWPDIDVVGITTNLDDGGTRAGCVEHVRVRRAPGDAQIPFGGSPESLEIFGRPP